MKRIGIMILAAGLTCFAQASFADWSSSKRITWNSGDSYDPRIAVDSSDNLHIVWQDNTPGNYAIFYKKSTDGGATWSSNKRLTWDSNYDIYYMKSSDGGASWSSVQNLSSNSGLSNTPAIATDFSDKLHVVWFENVTALNYEIYYKRGTAE